MNYMKLLSYIAVSFLVFIYSDCSHVSNTSTAGAAGAGNPATLSFIANVADTTYKNGFYTPRWDTSHFHIPVKDFEKSKIDVYAIYILAQKLSFQIPENFNIEEDLHSPLHLDSGKLSLDGPFVFDMLRGTSTPAINFLLPNGLYDSLCISLAPNDSKVSELIDTLFCDYQIILQGMIQHKDSLRKVYIYIPCNEIWEIPSLSPISFAQNDSAHMVVGFDETLWLDSISLKGVIKKDELKMDDEGNLYIKPQKNMGPGFQLTKRIRNNMYRSALLKKKNN